MASRNCEDLSIVYTTRRGAHVDEYTNPADDTPDRAIRARANTPMLIPESLCYTSWSRPLGPHASLLAQ